MVGEISLPRKIYRRIHRALIEARVIAHHWPTLKFDPNFSLKNFSDGFAERDSLKPSREMLERIISAYKKAKEKQKNVAPHLLVSNEWLPIYERHLGKIIDALESEDIDAVTRTYCNFMRDEVSTGLTGMPVDMKKTYFSGKVAKWHQLLFLINSLYRFNLWKLLLPGVSVKALAAPNIGNPYGYYMDNEFVRVGAEYQHYYATKSLSFLGQNGRCVVLELGGGFGGYAFFLHTLSKVSPVLYIDLDLPEILALASFYLMAAFPEKRFLLFGESSNDYENLGSYDFVLLPNFEIESIPQDSIDLVFNSYSLAEMAPDTIQAYVRSFGEICRGIIFHVNHVRRALLGADDFGIEGAGFELVERKKALWNMGTYLEMDEFEFVYKRQASTFATAPRTQALGDIWLRG